MDRVITVESTPPARIVGGTQRPSGRTPSLRSMSDVAGEFEAHGRFERTDAEPGGDDSEDAETFLPTANDWDATVTVRGDAVEIEVVVPTLDAATNDEVADVVEDGWYDTFERRVAGADSVTLADDVEVANVSRVAGDITVELAMDPRSGKAADDALALVNYVEGTWFQGVVPGYDYVEQVQEMREQAAQNAQSTDGTPL
jgi:hypothetical protein